MTCADPTRLVAAMAALRRQHPTLTALHLELVIRVALGQDTRTLLIAETGAPDPTIRRSLRVLTGQGYIDSRGQVAQSGVALLRREDHPHRQGFRYVLTSDALMALEQAGLPVQTQEAPPPPDDPGPGA